MKRVLFVDDEPNVLDGLRRMLHPMRKEWEMTFVSGGEEALAALAERRYDVVVTDMRMPGMDGAQLLSEVMRRHPQMVRVVLSGHSEKEMVLRSVGPTHQYLAKPCDPEQLTEVINRACTLHDLLNEESLRELVSQMSTVPSLPQSYAEIVEELQLPEASVKKVGQIISKDMGMTAKVLQLANSAFFGLRHHVADPSQAVSFLGIDTLKALVLSVHIFSQFDDVELGGLCVGTLWNHSAATGALAKSIAVSQGSAEQIRDHALTAGLLHDAGKLVIAANLPEHFRSAQETAKSGGIELWEAERQILTNTHAEVGAYLLGLWGLPDPIVEAVAFHHNPNMCPQDEFTALTAVHVANVLDRQLGDAGDGSSPSQIDIEYLDRLGLTERLQEWQDLIAPTAHGETAQ